MLHFLSAARSSLHRFCFLSLLAFSPAQCTRSLSRKHIVSTAYSPPLLSLSPRTRHRLDPLRIVSIFLSWTLSPAPTNDRMFYDPTLRPLLWTPSRLSFDTINNVLFMTRFTLPTFWTSGHLSTAGDQVRLPVQPSTRKRMHSRLVDGRVWL